LWIKVTQTSDIAVNHYKKTRPLINTWSYMFQLQNKYVKLTDGENNICGIPVDNIYFTKLPMFL